MITVLAWGAWLAPSQNVPLKNQQIKAFYVGSVNLVLAFLISLGLGLGQVTWNGFWLPFLGGLIWALSGLCAFTATHHLGMARAFGIWAPLNIMVSLGCGVVMFQEFRNTTWLNQLLLAGAIVVIIAGVLLIIFARGGDSGPRPHQNRALGLLGALGAGILWGIYFIPIKLSGVSMWIGALPMAAGIFTGSGLLVLLGRQSPRLERRGDYWRIGATGLLWTTGNYGMLLLVGHLGAGKGYTIAQLSVVVNALVGIFLLKDPLPGSRAAGMTLIGCVLATAGGILLGNLNK